MIKQSQIYGWDEEPVDERPSEFMVTTGYAVLSGYHPMNDPLRGHHTRSRFGFRTLLVFCALVLSLGFFALLELVPLLRA